MRYLRLIIQILIVAACVVGIYFSYTYLKSAKANQIEVLDILPNDAMLVFQSDKIVDDWRQLNTSNLIWESLKEDSDLQQFVADFQEIDSILIEDNSIETLLNSRTSTFSIHFDNHTLDYAFTLQLKNTDEPKQVYNKIKTVLSKKYTLKTSNTPITEIQTDQGKRFLTNYHNLIIVASSRELLDAFNHPSIEPNKLTSLRNKKGSGFDVQGNILANFKILHLYLKKVLPSSPFTPNFLHGFSLSDLAIDAKTIVLRGLTPYTQNPILSVLKNQKNKPFRALEALPSDVTAFVRYAFEYSTDTSNQYISGINNSEINSRIDETDLRLGTDIHTQLYSWLGKEVISGIDADQHKFLLLNIDPLETHPEKLILSYANAANAHTKTPIDSFRYRHFRCLNLSLQTGYENLFGDSFDMTGEAWFGIDSTYVVVCSSKAQLKSYIRSLKRASLLENPSIKENFNKYFGNTSVMMLYAKPFALTQELLKPYLKKTISASFPDMIDLSEHLDFFALQVIIDQSHISHNLAIAYQNETHETAKDLWHFEIDTTLIGKPFRIFNHRSQSDNFLVQDANFKLYLLSTNGKVLWNKIIDGPILGEVTQIDAYKNDKLQMVFNTRNRIHILDILGRDLKHFPVTLETKATAGITVTDYDKKRNYNFILPTSKSILNYNIEGKPSEGWVYESNISEISQRLTVLKILGKSYLFSTYVDGKILLLDKNGSHIDLSEEGLIAQLPDVTSQTIAIETSNSLVTSKMIYIDSNAILYNRYLGGSADSIPLLGNWSNLRLQLIDINLDNTTDYVLTSDDKLLIYGRDKEMLTRLKLPERSWCGVYKSSTWSYLVVSDLQDEITTIYNYRGEPLHDINTAITKDVLMGDFNKDGEPDMLYFKAPNQVWLTSF